MNWKGIEGFFFWFRQNFTFQNLSKQSFQVTHGDMAKPHVDTPLDPYSVEGLVHRHENRQLLLQRLSLVRQQIKNLEREVPLILTTEKRGLDLGWGVVQKFGLRMKKDKGINHDQFGWKCGSTDEKSIPLVGQKRFLIWSKPSMACLIHRAILETWCQVLRHRWIVGQLPVLEVWLYHWL